jgi:hypothetical protein
MPINSLRGRSGLSFHPDRFWRGETSVAIPSRLAAIRLAGLLPLPTGFSATKPAPEDESSEREDCSGRRDDERETVERQIGRSARP